MMSIPIPIILANYRLSRVYSGGQDYQIYNRIIVLSKYPMAGSGKFVEGFGAKEFIVESYRGTYQFRKQTVLPVMLHEFDKFIVIGNEIYSPTIRSLLSITIEPMGLDLSKPTNDHLVFSAKLQDIDASYGELLEAYNSEELGTNTNIEFYDRNVARIGGHRNMLGSRRLLTPTPPPEKIGERIFRSVENE